MLNCSLLMWFSQKFRKTLKINLRPCWSLHIFPFPYPSHSEGMHVCDLLNVWSIWFSSLCVCCVFQLQLEIALLQGELQTEKTQLQRYTQKLQSLQLETGRTEKSRHSVRRKVLCEKWILNVCFQLVHDACTVWHTCHVFMPWLHREVTWDNLNFLSGDNEDLQCWFNF